MKAVSLATVLLIYQQRFHLDYHRFCGTVQSVMSVVGWFIFAELWITRNTFEGDQMIV